jgi:hypothetical protein
MTNVLIGAPLIGHPMQERRVADEQGAGCQEPSYEMFAGRHEANRTDSNEI